MAKLVDAPDLGSGGVTRGGSSPSSRTILIFSFIIRASHYVFKMIKIEMRLILYFLIIVLFPIFAFAQTVGEDSGLPIPRFVSLRGEIVYARTGPGTRYPIKWVYEKENLPVEIVQEFDTWRKVRDIDGEEAWVHQSLLTGRRFAILHDTQSLPLLKKPQDDAYAVALVEPGVILSIIDCENKWCEVSAMGFKGFIYSDSIWGVYEGERIQ